MAPGFPSRESRESASPYEPTSVRVADDRSIRRDRAMRSLDGLSVGDAFGERFFGPSEAVLHRIDQRIMPPGPWRWTDDTAMAISIVETLSVFQQIDSAVLARAFARRFMEEPDRGYGGGAYRILTAIARGVPWEEAAGSAFGGQGSMGNGAAMRAAPIGAWFADDLDIVVDQAARSAAPTHAHPDGQAGAIAVAVAAALASSLRTSAASDDPRELLRLVIERTPHGLTRDGLVTALDYVDADASTAAAALGSGALVISRDTVPFSILAAARHLRDFEEALWFTVAGLGDRDTTCAIVGGIVALSATTEIPTAWLEAREAVSLSMG